MQYVVDCGSNTLKAFAFESKGGAVYCTGTRRRAVRLSKDFTPSSSVLAADTIEDAVDAIDAMLAELGADDAPAQAIRIVGTSALRDAENLIEFTDELFEVTGLELTLLSGEEEALAIAKGVQTDPALGDLGGTFTVLDIGGGSLEIITLQSGAVGHALSLPLGAVRLTKQCIPPEALANPISGEVMDAMLAHIKKTVLSAFKGVGLNAAEVAKLPQPRICSGGSLATAAALLNETGNWITCEALAGLTIELAAMPLAQREAVPNMPPGRADVLVAALTVLLAFAELTDTKGYFITHHNLPYGLVG